MSVPASSNISGKQGTTIVNSLTVTPRQHPSTSTNPLHNAHRLSTPNAALPGFDIARTVQIGAASVTVTTTPPANRCRSTPHDSGVPSRPPATRHGNLSPPSRSETAAPETGGALFSSAAAAAPGLVISIASATAALKQMKILFGVPIEFSLSSTFNKVSLLDSI